MKSLRYAGMAAGLALLAGCGTPVDSMDSGAISGGTPFTQELARQYGDLANFENNRMKDYTDGYYFAQKASAAAAGNVVAPTDLSEFTVPAGAVAELQDARGRLVSWLDAGARQNQPVEAAYAQVKFDCWVEQAEENFQLDHIASCRDEFNQVVEVQPPAQPTDAVYFVFFDFDRSDITAAASEVLDRVASDFFAGTYAGIDVDGHADRSGSDAYNQALGQRRANSVASALQARGVPANAIFTQTFGENQPLVETPDGVREPSNRRAEIRFQ